MITCSTFAPSNRDHRNDQISTANCRIQKHVEMYMKARLAVKMGGRIVAEDGGDDDDDAFAVVAAVVVEGYPTSTVSMDVVLPRACSANSRVRISSKVVAWLLAVTHNFHRRSLEFTYGLAAHRRPR